MLPDHLSSSYKQHNADTDAIASWLAATALRCGYPADLLTRQDSAAPPTPPSMKKNKKKNRKKNKKKAARKTTATDTTASALKFVFTLSDFTSLAEYIAASTDPSVKVPDSLITVICRAVSVRKRLNAWFNSLKNANKDPEGQQAEEQHLRFISVLERVYEVLRLRMSETIDQETVQSQAQTSDQILAENFEDLQVEEPSGNSFNTSAQLSGEKSKTIVGIVYETDESQWRVNLYIGMHCIFDDLNAIREVLRRTWSGYKTGTYDLVAAAIITDIAVDLVRQLEQDFLEHFEEQVMFETVISYFYNAQCFIRGEDPEKREQPGDIINFTMYDEAERLFIPTYVVLSTFQGFLDAYEGQGDLPGFKPESIGSYDPSEDHSKKDARKRFAEDKVVLLENLSDFCLTINHTNRIPAEDGLTSTLRLMMETKRIPLRLMFAAQVYLDIHHIMREDTERGFTTLDHAARLIESSINQNLDFHMKLRAQNWPPHNDGGFHDILRRINCWVKADPWELTRQHAGCTVPTKPHRFMKHHPWYCGLFTYSLKVLMHDVGVHFANAWGFVLYASHLYNAVRQEKLLTSEWTDMELLINLHGPAKLFVGDYPTRTEDYMKRFLLISGAPVTAFAKDKRGQPLASSESSPTALSLLAPVAQIFKSRFCSENSVQVDLQPEDVEKILKASGGFTRQHKRNQRLAEKEPGTSQTDNPEPGHSTSQAIDGTDGSEHALTPVKLLQSLRTALASELLPLTFDHLRLHRTCWILLRQINSDCEHLLEQIFGPDYLENESQLPFVVGYIFMAATKAEGLRSGGSGLKERKGDVLTGGALRRVTGEVLRRTAESVEGMVGRFLREMWGVDVDASRVGD